MDDSILNSIKLDVGIPEEDTSFDHELITLINTSLFRCRQLNVGADNFVISDQTAKWSDFLGEDINKYAIVKSLIKDNVQLAFDPPSNSFLVSAIEKRIEKYEALILYESDPVYE